MQLPTSQSMSEVCAAQPAAILDPDPPFLALNLSMIPLSLLCWISLVFSFCDFPCCSGRATPKIVGKESKNRAKKNNKHKHFGRDGVRDKQEPTIVPQAPSEKCLCVFCLLVFLLAKKRPQKARKIAKGKQQGNKKNKERGTVAQLGAEIWEGDERRKFRCLASGFTERAEPLQ